MRWALKKPAASRRQGSRFIRLLTQTECLNECAVFVNVFFRVVLEQTLALRNHREKAAASRVIFFELAQVCRKAFNAIGQEGYLYFSIARVGCTAAVLSGDFRDFLFAVVNCHVVECEK